MFRLALLGGFAVWTKKQTVIATFFQRENARFWPLSSYGLGRWQPNWGQKFLQLSIIPKKVKLYSKLDIIAFSTAVLLVVGILLIT